jgi:hypothetical protein
MIGEEVFLMSFESLSLHLGISFIVLLAGIKISKMAGLSFSSGFSEK